MTFLPAYVLLSSLGTLGRFAFVHCLEQKKSFTLHYGWKNCWFDLHCRFLPHVYPFQKNKMAFIKGEVEQDGQPPKLTTCSTLA